MDHLISMKTKPSMNGPSTIEDALDISDDKKTHPALTGWQGEAGRRVAWGGPAPNPPLKKIKNKTRILINC